MKLGCRSLNSINHERTYFSKTTSWVWTAYWIWFSNSDWMVASCTLRARIQSMDSMGRNSRINPWTSSTPTTSLPVQRLDGTWTRSRLGEQSHHPGSSVHYCPSTHCLRHAPDWIWSIKKKAKRGDNLQRKPTRPSHRPHPHLLIHGSISWSSQGHLGLSKSSQKVLVGAFDHYDRPDGCSHSFHSRISCRSIYLLNILSLKAWK